jgi:biotin carboxyl carrier protein
MTKVNIGKNIEMDVDFATMPQAALDHLLYIGARNVLMDSHASITKESNPSDTEAAARAMAEKKLAALMAGEVRVSTAREGDPVRAEALRSATAVIVAALKKAGTIKKLADIDGKLLREKAGELIAKQPAFMEKARETVDARKSATVDLADIGL